MHPETRPSWQIQQSFEFLYHEGYNGRYSEQRNQRQRFAKVKFASEDQLCLWDTIYWDTIPKESTIIFNGSKVRLC
jgi:hypothetical protein